MIVKDTKDRETEKKEKGEVEKYLKFKGNKQHDCLDHNSEQSVDFVKDIRHVLCWKHKNDCSCGLSGMRIEC